MIGRVIGNYKIVEKLGEGGMGAVYKGIDTMLDREVAVKALKPELASQTAIVERFRKEAVTLAKLHHPNIATLYSMFRQGEELFMVLEYVRGRCLDDIIARRGAMDASEVMPVFCQILDGINHAHEFGIIHRDIKPGNMILTDNGTLKVLDFGIARLLGSNRMTRAGHVIGTLEYMAPEQVKGLDTDARSDTYALGMMLYEVLTGRTPFDTDNEFELMKMQTEMMPPLPRSINPNIPQAIEEVIVRSIQKDPDLRFQTAGEFRDAVVAIGYAENGTLRRTTDPGARTATAIHVSTPPQTASPPANTGDAPLKETRFAPQDSVSAAPQAMKETRLGSADAVQFTGSDETAASFFSKLTWVHYTIAGSAAAVVLFGLFIIPVLIFTLGSTAPAAAANSNTNANGSQKPGSVAVSTPEPVPERTQPTPAPTSTPTMINTVPTATPLPEPTPATVVRDEPKPTTKRPTTKRSTTKRSSQPDVRCALTGDC
ncbi:MAG TPA: serine/threonine-protein kinase [Pyrinomonadaceae bacterium]|nr:serine/threonine-protein kinase [Pyrinomonadaceae bacterium]